MNARCRQLHDVQRAVLLQQRLLAAARVQRVLRPGIYWSVSSAANSPPGHVTSGSADRQQLFCALVPSPPAPPIFFLPKMPPKKSTTASVFRHVLDDTIAKLRPEIVQEGVDE